jgi:hypothetical protein
LGLIRGSGLVIARETLKVIGDDIAVSGRGLLHVLIGQFGLSRSALELIMEGGEHGGDGFVELAVREDVGRGGAVLKYSDGAADLLLRVHDEGSVRESGGDVVGFFDDLINQVLGELLAGGLGGGGW